MHTLIPHVHLSKDVCGVGSMEAYLEASSILDFIDWVLHPEMGEGHLEVYERGEDIDIVLDIDISVYTTPQLPVLYYSRYGTSMSSAVLNPFEPYLFQKSSLLRHTQFRGPPFIL